MPIAYEDLKVSLVLGRGVVVETAPEHTKISVSVLASNPLGLTVEYPGRVKIAHQVGYEITGYDPTDGTLTLHLAKDWRPGQKDDPNAEPTDTIDLTPYLAVSRYRTDRGGWEWGWRCDGDGTCDGHVALDLNNRAHAERNAREHLADEHPDATPEQIAPRKES